MKKIGIIVFPGTNCDRDVFHVLTDVMHVKAEFVWHNKDSLKGFAAVVLPGGFSYGDRLRAGIIAAHSPIIREVRKVAAEGVPVLGICNGFQILVEAGLLPGALLSNENLSFVCKWVDTRVENEKTPFTNLFQRNHELRMPVAHGEGRYVADRNTLNDMKQKNQIVLKFATINPNGSVESIASVCSAEGNVVGMMPHPERSSEGVLSPTGDCIDGAMIFRSMMRYLGAT